MPSTWNVGVDTSEDFEFNFQLFRAVSYEEKYKAVNLLSTLLWEDVTERQRVRIAELTEKFEDEMDE